MAPVSELVVRVHAGHAAACALRAYLEGRHVLLRGMTGDEIADLERALTACGATTTCDRSERAVEMVLFGSRASRRDREAAADRGCPVLERGDVTAVLLARAALDDTDQSIELPEPATGLSLIRSA